MKIKVKKESLKDYKSRGYIENENGYSVKAKECFGVFIKEFGYIILNSDLEVLE